MNLSRPGLIAERTVLLVNGERRATDAMRANLETAGYRICEASSVAETLLRLRDELPDLVLVAATTPLGDGLQTLHEVRAVSDVPIVVVADARSEEDGVRALEMGADDYVARPLSDRELLGRLKAVLRRAEMPPPVGRTEIRVDDNLQIDFGRHLVVANGRPVQLRPTEYRLLYHLVNNAGRVLTHATLLAKVWGYDYRYQTHYLRLYVAYLRDKIEPDPFRPRYILTERGIGYRFTEF